MKTITAKQITAAVSRLCVQANRRLRPDVVAALRRALRKEQAGRSRRMLKAVLENARCAAARGLAICQDTGLPAVFIRLGNAVRISGNFEKAVLDGIEQGYRAGYFRPSIVQDPLARGRSSFRGAVIHTDIVPGSGLEIAVLPKGFGCENKTKLKMFNPTAGIEAVKDFIVQAVREAGPDACPPYVVGVGIGGSAEYACLLAKKALLRPIGAKAGALEQDLLARINRLGIGPMGLGGRTTALAVQVLRAPTHIAGLPAAVSISCHALRSARVRL